MKSLVCPSEEKRKSRTVSTFLKKTYELLNVLLSVSRIASTAIASDGPLQESALSSSTRRPSQRQSFPATSNTATTLPSSDSSTCITSTKYGKIARKATSIMNASPPTTETPSLTLRENLRRKKRKTTIPRRRLTQSRRPKG